MKFKNILAVVLLTAGWGFFPASVWGQENAKEDSQASGPDMKALYDKLTKTLSGAKLTGRFTIIGKEDRPPKAEEYTILDAKKLDRGDFWLLRARIKYGDKDLTVPLPLTIKWAGDTPVITLTNFKIPGLGTFDSRVVIYNNKYAGTWRHDKVGGHLYGTIKKVKE